MLKSPLKVVKLSSDEAPSKPLKLALEVANDIASVN